MDRLTYCMTKLKALVFEPIVHTIATHQYEIHLLFWHKVLFCLQMKVALSDDLSSLQVLHHCCKYLVKILYWSYLFTCVHVHHLYLNITNDLSSTCIYIPASIFHIILNKAHQWTIFSTCSTYEENIKVKTWHNIHEIESVRGHILEPDCWRACREEWWSNEVEEPHKVC